MTPIADSETPGGSAARTATSAGADPSGRGRLARAADWWKDPLAAVVAIGSLVGFAVLVFYLVRHVGDTELAWSRRIYIFGAVEAITFAAVGWLFGREVHRQQAQVAEERAEQAEERASDATAQMTENSAAASAGQARAQAAEQRASGAENRLQSLSERFDQESQAAMMHRERARALKHAVLAARQVQPRVPAEQSAGLAPGLAPVATMADRQLDALAELAARVVPED